MPLGVSQMTGAKEPSILLLNTRKGPSLSCFSRFISLPFLQQFSSVSSITPVVNQHWQFLQPHSSQFVPSECLVHLSSVPRELWKRKSRWIPVYLLYPSAGGITTAAIIISTEVSIG